MPEKHTAQNIQDRLVSVTEEWWLPTEKLPVFVVTDNAGIITPAVNAMNVIHFRCVGRTLQLAIKDAKLQTAGIDTLCRKAHGIVGHSKHSQMALKRLEGYQLRIDIALVVLIQEDNTR